MTKQELLDYYKKIRLELIEANMYNGGLDDVIEIMTLRVNEMEETNDKEINEVNQT